MTEKLKTPSISPIFSHFLKAKIFAVLFTLAIVAIIFGSASTYVTGNSGLLTSNILGLIIVSFLAPAIYFFVKSFYATYARLFKPSDQRLLNLDGNTSQDEEFAYLFSSSSEFERYKKEVSRPLTGNSEKIFIVGGSIITFVLARLSEVADGTLKNTLSLPLLSLPLISSITGVVVWSFIGAIVLSVVWFIIATLRAILRLSSEKTKFQVTESLSKLSESMKLPEQNKLARARIGLLDLSFRRFKTGLSPITNFILSLSLKIAFLGGFFSIPPLVFFLTTRLVSPYWYALAVFVCAFSVAVFIIGNYGVWRIWSTSKKEANRLIDSLCKGRTETCSNILSTSPESSEAEIREIEKEVGAIRRISMDISSLDTSTYKASSVFKLISVNFLAFGPFILERLIVALVSR